MDTLEQQYIKFIEENLESKQLKYYINSRVDNDSFNSVWYIVFVKNDRVHSLYMDKKNRDSERYSGRVCYYKIKDDFGTHYHVKVRLTEEIESLFIQCYARFKEIASNDFVLDKKRIDNVE